MLATVCRVMILVYIFSMLVGCGGSSGASSASRSNVYVSGIVNRGLWPTAASGFQEQQMASVTVATTNLNGPAIASANVAINDTTLIYNAQIKRFEGTVVSDLAGKFVLTVKANGETHTAIAAAMTSGPVVSVPSPFYATQANTISWVAPGGVVAGATPINYYIDVYNISSFQPIAHTKAEIGTSTVVPANTTYAATQYFATVYAYYVSTWIDSAASGSNFTVSSTSAQVYFTPQ